MAATDPELVAGRAAAHVSLEALALAELASRLAVLGAAAASELEGVAPPRGAPNTPDGRRRAAVAALDAPHPDDTALVELGLALELTPAELLSVRLAGAVDRRFAIGRAVSRLQAPVGGARPTVGLLAALFDPDASEGLVWRLADGPAAVCGLLLTGNPGAPLPERPVAVPGHVLAALDGRDAPVEGVALCLDNPLPLSPSLRAAAERQARGLRAGRGLVLRSSSQAEARAVAEALATALGRRPLFLEGEPFPGLTPWLHLSTLLPVFVRDLGPGERARLPELPGYRGPVLVVSNLEGAFTLGGNAVASWVLDVPPVDERAELWERALGDGAAARQLAERHRHGPGRIAELGRLARQRAETEGREKPTRTDVIEVGRAGDAGGLETLAQPLTERIAREALILTDDVARDLESLVLRCRHRETLVDGLGVSAVTRYGIGVSALLVGPSGTGKTLAAGWLASELELPLYRVDLASIISKYIGETEKNLARLMAEAEHAEVVLLFDEADSLFGKRTEVKQANDRFANAQTNYLLQRIESYSGISILTSNSRTRFDSAFTRRLDMIIEFQLPTPRERRALWDTHLGTAHRLEVRQLNQLAATSDLCGGHIRNVVLAAAVHAREAGRPVEWRDVLRGLAVEYRKIGRPVPAGLRETG